MNVTRMAQALERTGGPSMAAGSPSLEVLRKLTPQEGDFTFTISHGAMTSFQDSGLDSLLRNIGIKTVVPVGISLNVAIIGAVIEAINRNYRCIVPTDCVAGFPDEYGDMILQHTVRGVAVLTTAGQLAEAWGLTGVPSRRLPLSTSHDPQRAPPRCRHLSPYPGHHGVWRAPPQP